MNLGEVTFWGDFIGERTPSSNSPGEAAGLSEESLYLRAEEDRPNPASNKEAGEVTSFGGLRRESVRCKHADALNPVTTVVVLVLVAKPVELG